MGIESYMKGITGEDLAVCYLRGEGYVVLERNYRSTQGEIDIIAKDKDVIVFVEVKNYSYRSYNSPLVAVNKAKRLSIIHAATTYIYKNNIKDTNCRFDVLTIQNKNRFMLIRDAFNVS